MHLDVSKSQGQSYIENHEVDTAKALIDQQFKELTGKPFGYRVCGPYVIAKIFTRPEELKVIPQADGTTVTLWAPPNMVDNDKYHQVAALVCGVGPEAFTGLDSNGQPRFPHGPRCRVGDWINIPRNNSFMFQYRSVALAQLYDDMVLGVVEDPRDLTPINQKPLI